MTFSTAFGTFQNVCLRNYIAIRCGLSYRCLHSHGKFNAHSIYWISIAFSYSCGLWSLEIHEESNIKIYFIIDNSLKLTLENGLCYNRMQSVMCKLLKTLCIICSNSRYSRISLNKHFSHRHRIFFQFSYYFHFLFCSSIFFNLCHRNTVSLFLSSAMLLTIIFGYSLFILHPLFFVYSLSYIAQIWKLTCQLPNTNTQLYI